eukprot:scaffold344726_cov41-Prasinocladus_malaysianus.AAC.1
MATNHDPKNFTNHILAKYHRVQAQIEERSKHAGKIIPSSEGNSLSDVWVHIEHRAGDGRQRLAAKVTDSGCLHGQDGMPVLLGLQSVT